MVLSSYLSSLTGLPNTAPAVVGGGVVVTAVVVASLPLVSAGLPPLPLSLLPSSLTGDDSGSCNSKQEIKTILQITKHTQESMECFIMGDLQPILGTKLA